MCVGIESPSPLLGQPVGATYNSWHSQLAFGTVKSTPCCSSLIRGDRHAFKPAKCPARDYVCLPFTTTFIVIDRGAAPRYTRVDPAAEITRIRQSLTLLESHILQNGGRSSTTAQPPTPSPSIAPPKITTLQTPPSTQHRNVALKQPTGSTSPDLSEAKTSSAPGLLGQSDPSGFYAGPTSALSHLLSVS